MEAHSNISDKEAVNLLNVSVSRRAQPANVFVKRTVVYPVTVYYKPEVPTNEIRVFLYQGSYCSKTQWEKALDYEKQYPDLQKGYRAKLKAMGIPEEAKEVANPLNATIISMS